ncbi:MAG: ATP-dependent Clp protease ATP-binding subunit ClpX, partial [Planctomycetaceae bacterium]
FGVDQSDQNAVQDEEENILTKVCVEDILQFGLIPEFVGRLPVVAALHPLREEDLMRILTEPKNSLIRQYEKFFEMEGATIEFSDDAIREIASIAAAKETGARGLRSVIEEAMFEILFELPDQESGQTYSITPEIIRGDETLFPDQKAA